MPIDFNKKHMREYLTTMWLKDVSKQFQLIRGYVGKRLKGEKSDLPFAVVLDIDEVCLCSMMEHDLVSSLFMDSYYQWSKDKICPAIQSARDFYIYLICHKVKVFFITERPESQRALTAENLRHTMFKNYSGLIMYPDKSKLSIKDFKTAERKTLAESHVIIANIGDHHYDLGDYAEMNFLINNPFY